MGHSHFTNIEIPWYIIHFTRYTSVYEQICTCNGSIFSHNTSLSEILRQATYRTWWKHIDHSALPFLVSFVPRSFHCSDHPQYPFSLLHWPPYWPNQSRNIWCSTHNLVLWAFWDLIASVQPDIEFVICLPTVIALILIIQVTIPVKPIFCVGNALRFTTVITFHWMIVNWFDMADIYCLSSSSREILCRASGWQLWSFWQFKCSHTIGLKV